VRGEFAPDAMHLSYLSISHVGSALVLGANPNVRLAMKAIAAAH
jgi:hypothetical protein